jgi:hypothetical protein
MHFQRLYYCSCAPYGSDEKIGLMPLVLDWGYLYAEVALISTGVISIAGRA